ncbi:dTDP-L-rhamnose 4-epimerase [Burkholderia pyrrocinia]|uniref:dTDP-L-rhamnose 4-epimerase n=2 Tax=Burkholderiaceae TaxID=119060 RepID=A0A318IWD4_BURPY|nr:dTDP-L-rhamnose 4-epimerase [Burkholderia pyrrocinia]SFW19188.1 dTDP-L-rhamnose 4-epimerase [Burkholderia sp. NFACC33-1]SFX15724.1 dTDP-L-rhamnose 4-epimerase [Burkholderia sp. NFPP32]
MSERNCLVTGGAGFIGSALSQQLVSRFDKVVAVDCLHPQIHAKQTRPAALHPGVELVVGDVCDATVWDNVLASFRPEVVVHLAAETGTGQSLTEATRHAHTNVVGTTAMLDAFMRHDAKPKRIVLSSSRAVYGEGAWQGNEGGSLFYPGQRSVSQLAAGKWNFDGFPVAMEADRVHPAPVSVYGATKLAQEHVISSWANAVGTEYVILRLQNVFGPGQSLINSYTGIVSLFCQLARKKQSIPLYEDGMVMRDFILIDDIAAALFAASTVTGISGRVFDIGSGVATTLLQLAEKIAALYGAPAPEVVGKYRFGDVRHAFTSAEGAKGLGWAPKHDLDYGLKVLAQWIEGELQHV